MARINFAIIFAAAAVYLASAQVTSTTQKITNATTTQKPSNASTTTQKPTNATTTQKPSNESTTTQRPTNATTTQKPSNESTTTQRPTNGSTTTGATTSRQTSLPQTTKTSDTNSRQSVIWNRANYTKDALKKLNKVFDNNTLTTFSGNVFNSSSGNVSQDFLKTVDGNVTIAIDDFQGKWKKVFNLSSIFSDSMPEDLEYFASEYNQMNQSKFQKLNATPNAITPDDLKDIPLSILGAMNETVRSQKFANLTKNCTEYICRRLLNGEADYNTTKGITKTLDCASVLGNLTAKTLTTGILGQATVENRMTAKNVSLWNATDYTQAITQGWFSALPDSVIKACPAQVITANLNNILPFTSNMDKKSKASLLSKLNDTTGRFSIVSSSQLIALGNMVKDLSEKQMKELNISVIRASLSTFRDNVDDMSGLQKVQLRKTLKDSYRQSVNWTSSEIANITTFIGRDSYLINTIDKAVIIGNLSAVGKNGMDVASANTFAKKIRESPDYDDGSDYSNTKFQNMGNITKGLAARFIKNMTNVNFATLLTNGSLQYIDYPMEVASTILKRIMSDNKTFTLGKTEITKLGRNIKGLQKEDVNNISGTSLAEALYEMNATLKAVYNDLADTTIDSMITKIESVNGTLGPYLEKMGSLLQAVPVKKLKSLNSSSFGDMSGKKERFFNCSSDTCPELYRRVVNTIGNPGISNANFTMTVFKNLKQVMCGMALDDIRLISATKMLPDLAGYLASLKCLSYNQETVLADKIKYQLGLFGNTVRQIRRQDVKIFGGLLKYFSVNDFQRIGQGVCADISLELGAQDLTNINNVTLKNFTEFALECLNKTTGNLTADDMTTLGNLVCGLNATRVVDIVADALPDVIFNVQSKCSHLSSNDREIWATKAIEKLNITSSTISNATEVTLIQIGTFLADVNDTLLDNIPSAVWKSVGSDIVDQFTERKQQLEKRDRQGFSSDLSTSDRLVINAKEVNLYLRLINAYANGSIASISGRKKRSTFTTLSCDNMKLLGAGVTALTTNQISAMSDNDFLDCVNFLGQFSTWNGTQLTALLNVSVRQGTFGPTYNWSAENVASAGIIVQAFNASKISSLKVLTMDAMLSIGQFDGWTDAQLAAGFSTWLNLNKNGNASSITPTELISLGNFACGATTAQISAMSPTSYSNAASYVGSLTSCSASQYNEYAALAKKAFGPISTWDMSVLSNIGCVIAGLTASELTNLTNSQIASIDLSSLAEIPPSAFAGFTADQFSSFSYVQGRSVTPSQLALLSKDQLSALAATGAITVSTTVIDLPHSSTTATEQGFVTMLLIVLASVCQR